MQLISFVLCLALFHRCSASTEVKSELSEDSDDDYGDYADESEVGKQTRQRNSSNFERVGTFYSWDRWEKWSKCSTTCVQIKKRKCIERFKNSTEEATVERRFYPGNGTVGCFGVLKRYRQCKEERCKAGKQRLRDEQCERFNSVPYREVFYNWLGYEKERDECILFCRPVNSDLVISMNQSVTDGTPCNRPAVYYTRFYRLQAVCVEGICRAVHSSGLIRPVTTRDSQLKCGSVLCKLVTQIFNQTNLTENYNYIAKIPIGAMNLSIRQTVQLNGNSLALKSPGEVFIPSANRSKTFTFNGDRFEYNLQNGLITSRGPLLTAVTLMYYCVDIKSAMNDVQYNYTIPVSSAPVIQDEELQAVWDKGGKLINDTDAGYGQRIRERKRQRFTWKLVRFGECNRSCGPGTQTPIFRCVSGRESAPRHYSPIRCASVEKPTFNDDIYNCNKGLCPAFWRPISFSSCECPEGSSFGQRIRRFECMQEQIKGNVILVSDKLCPDRENLSEQCRCQDVNEKVNNATQLKVEIPLSLNF